MKVYDAASIRNVAVVGHGGCGKTQLVSALLFAAGMVNRLGRVDDGTSREDESQVAFPFRQRHEHRVRLRRDADVLYAGARRPPRPRLRRAGTSQAVESESSSRLRRVFARIGRDVLAKRVAEQHFLE